ncbi:hypothetical protein AB0F11_27945 [Streptomyces sp. NPDC032472]|uniref:hypothetical protein n=1 Tax=Streptomyces sp. NPDC032472 TaxID=3155018 RepID=UPI0033CAE4A6
MQTNDAWLDIGGNSSQGLVLAVDFTATGRPDARFADLLELAATGRPAWETLPQAIATDLGTGSATYLDRWFETVRASGRPVSAVLGFCAGATYATALADRITQWQEHAPQLILFDPEQANALGLYWQFHLSLNLFESIVGAEEIGRATAAGHEVLESTEDLGVLGAALISLFREVSSAAFDILDLDEETRAEFTDSFTAFVAYVVAAGEFRSTDGWARAVAFSSASPHSGLNRLRNAGQEDRARSLVARELRFDCEHKDLLRDESAARALAELLTAQDLARQIRI